MPGIWQMVIVGVVALVLFGGRGKISSIMGDLAKGITSFRKGLKEDADAPVVSDVDAPAAVNDARTIDGEAVDTAKASTPANAGEKP